MLPNVTLYVSGFLHTCVLYPESNHVILLGVMSCTLDVMPLCVPNSTCFVYTFCDTLCDTLHITSNADDKVGHLHVAQHVWHDNKFGMQMEHLVCMCQTLPLACCQTLYECRARSVLCHALCAHADGALGMQMEHLVCMCQTLHVATLGMHVPDLAILHVLHRACVTFACNSVWLCVCM